MEDHANKIRIKYLRTISIAVEYLESSKTTQVTVTCCSDELRDGFFLLVIVSVMQ